MSGPVRTQVVVVGGGPVGLAAAGCLAALGVDVVVVEQGTGPSRHPRATMVNARTMEVFRFLGVADEVRRAGVPTESSARISWVSSLAGPRIGVLELVESAEKLMRVAAQSPTLPLICPQAYVEAILAAAVTARPGATLLSGRRAVGIESGGSGVRVVHEATGGGDPQVVEARYAVLAEGVRGTLREQAGIRPVAQPPLGRMLDIHFAADLSAWTRGRESALYWVINRHLRGVLITVDPRRGEWLLEVPALTEDVGQELFDAACDHRQLLADAIGAPADARILSVRTWTMATTSVDRWRDPSGRVLVAGDAAHTFPPTGGFGMNTGIQDAHNLAWKVAGVLAGWAEPGLLDTYERERRPVADANGVHSEVNARLMGASMAEFTGPAADVLGAAGAAGDAARAGFGPEIERQRPHFDFSGQALGFRYVPAGDPGPVVGTVVDYRPSVRVGDRAPHAWLDGPDGRTSTLDLVGDEFALLTSAADAAGWGGAVTRSTGAPVRVAAVDPERGTALHDATGAVHALYPIGDGRAVLVRPDGHVAALLGGAEPDSELREALAEATGSTREGVLT